MKYLIGSLAAILFLTGQSLAQSKDSDDRCSNKKAAALASDYRELRDRRRRTAKRTRDKALDNYGGRLHQVLSSLGKELGHPPYTKEGILRCLGEPDAIRSHEQMGNYLGIYERELRKAGRQAQQRSDLQYLIYFWRGWHDFIFFISEDGVIVDHGWWFAYE